MAASNVWIICVVYATGLRSRGRPVSNPFEFDDNQEKIEYLNLTPVSSLQHNLTLSVQQGKVDNGTAVSVQEPSLDDKIRTIGTDERCTKLQKYGLDLTAMSCVNWKTTLEKATNELWRQGAMILADAAIAAIFFGAGVPLDPAGEMARTVGVLGVAGGGMVNAANATTGDDMAAHMVATIEQQLDYPCCRDGGARATSEDCKTYNAALAMFKKITGKHGVLKVAKTVTSAVAVTAPIVGMALDLFTGFLSLGSGTLVGGIVGVSASGCGVVLNTSHVIASCKQLSRISCCYKAVCPTTTTTTTTT